MRRTDRAIVHAMLSMSQRGQAKGKLQRKKNEEPDHGRWLKQKKNLFLLGNVTMQAHSPPFHSFRSPTVPEVIFLYRGKRFKKPIVLHKSNLTHGMARRMRLKAVTEHNSEGKGREDHEFVT